MNTNNIVPIRRKGNVVAEPGSFTRVARFIGNYHYFRRQGYTPGQAWQLASKTLPL